MLDPALNACSAISKKDDGMMSLLVNSIKMCCPCPFARSSRVLFVSVQSCVMTQAQHLQTAT